MSADVEYVPVETGGGGPGFFNRNTQRVRSFASAHTDHSTITVPRGLPPALATKKVIVYSWAASMAIISWDEWHNNKILPRPSRLWYATAFYLILVVFGMTQWTAAIANALAIGYTIMLAWQYFNGEGQFAAGGTS